MREKIRVAMLDDDKHILEIVHQQMQQHNGIDLVLKATNRTEFLENLQRVNPQIILLDVNIQERNDGLELVPAIKKLTNAKIIILTGDIGVNTLFTDGISYCLSKLHIELLSHVIMIVNQTKTSFELLSEEYKLEMEIKKLSEAERQIFNLILQGQSKEQMMKTTRKSENTIKSRIKAIHTKLSVNTHKELLHKFGHRKGEIF